MDKIIDDLNQADQNTQEALKNIKNASDKIESKFQVINNIYTEGGNITIERLGQAINSKASEVKLLKSIIKHLKGIINVKDAQIKLMLDTLTDNKNELDELKTLLKTHNSKED